MKRRHAVDPAHPRRHIILMIEAASDEDARRKRLKEAAVRALAEAEVRRAAAEPAAGAVPKEIGGRAGPEPTRYGDWEKGGIAVDF